MKILIVHRNTKFFSRLKKSLETESCTIESTTNAWRGTFMAKVNEYDAVILDCSMEEKHPLQFCTALRRTGKGVPIIGIGETMGIDERVLLFAAGLDDLMLQPISLGELLARLRALLRRGSIVIEETYRIGPLTLDSNRKIARLFDKRLSLSRKQFAFLEILMRNSGTVVSRGRIVEYVWESEADPKSNTIDTHISNLRKKLGKYGKLIRNVQGQGYILEE